MAMFQNKLKKIKNNPKSRIWNEQKDEVKELMKYTRLVLIKKFDQAKLNFSICYSIKPVNNPQTRKYNLVRNQC